jgi:mono/diheme cytochrome c family protein
MMIGGAMLRIVGICASVLLACVLVSEATAQDGGFQWQAAGAATYDTICAACHQPTGMGLPGTFPPLAEHAAAILARPGGRGYLVHVVLYGLEGEITVDGKTFNGTMPPLGDTLSDEQLAAALDHVLHGWDNANATAPGFTPIVPSEIADARRVKLTVAEVHAQRGQTLEAQSAATAETPVSFTAEQADRGRAAYRHACQDCHGFNLNDGEFGGAPLTGLYFAHHWGGGSIAALYGYMAAKMPPDRPGKLNPQTYADLVAFLLSKNGYSPGPTELPTDQDAEQHMTLKR